MKIQGILLFTGLIGLAFGAPNIKARNYGYGNRQRVQPTPEPERVASYQQEPEHLEDIQYGSMEKVFLHQEPKQHEEHQHHHQHQPAPAPAVKQHHAHLDLAPHVPQVPHVVAHSVAHRVFTTESPSQRLENERISEEQAKNAKYNFASAVDDGIMDQSQVRQESRDGLKVSGSYSYSDGFYKRTIRYEADENGYRIVGEETEAIGDGPQIDLVNGRADVHTQIEGLDNQYSVSAQEIQSVHSKKKGEQEQHDF